MARRRTFPMLGVKRGVMFAFGIIMGAWSAVTGIGAQAAAGPFVAFMLGYAEGKSAATAHAFALWCAAAAVLAWWAASTTPLPMMVCLLASIGATIGVLLAQSVGGALARGRRVGQSLAILLAVYVVADGARMRFGGPLTIPWEVLRTPVGWLVIGALCGFWASVWSVPVGALLVPGLVYAANMTPGAAAAASLGTVVLAGILPAVVHRSQGTLDSVVGPVMWFGGALGGAGGGYVLARLAPAGETWPLVAFGVTAMVLIAWLAYRAAPAARPAE